jgi:serine/threonine protein phosphatase PrpC
MVQNHQCTECGHSNRPEAKFCQKCGFSFTDEKAAPRKKKGTADKSKKANFFTKLLSIGEQVGKAGAQIAEGLDETLADAVKNVTGGSREVHRKDILNNAPTTAAERVSYAITPKRLNDRIGYYHILEVRGLKRSNYYKARIVRCECGMETLTREVCPKCNRPLGIFILRESAPGQSLERLSRESIEELSQNTPGALQHVKIFPQEPKQYVVLSGLPDTWNSLAERLPVTDANQVIQWISQLGNALKQIHANGYTFYDEDRLTDWIEPILILKNQQAYFADLTSCTRIAPKTPDSALKDIYYLTKVLYTLVTGDRQNVLRLSDPLLDVPIPFHNIISQARRGSYTTIDAFLHDLQEAPKAPELSRSLRQLVGYGTDVGRQRDHNEDFVSKFSLGLEQIPGTPEVGLYIVADGMGGHQSGEKASETVIRDVVINRIQEQMNKLQSVPKLKRATIKLDEMLTPGEILQEAIEQANQVLLEARSKVGSDRGTTITAALVVGDTCVAANVGDSRTYLMRNGKLDQITTDHSLVASLVAAGMIKPEEVRSHPQRNQIYRTLGDKPEIEVDIFQRSLVPGDKLLLCSDGLWEMVLDETIAQVIQQSPSPQAACDRLIDAANQAGGEDNISVIVVWLE